MASSWLYSWLSSWGNSWGVNDTTPAQTGGAGYWSTREIRRKRRKNTLQRDIENTYAQLQEVKQTIEAKATEVIEKIEAREVPVSRPDMSPPIMQARELQFRLDRLKSIVQYLERQQQDDEAMILLMSLPFVRIE